MRYPLTMVAILVAACGSEVTKESSTSSSQGGSSSSQSTSQGGSQGGSTSQGGATSQGGSGGVTPQGGSGPCLEADGDYGNCDLGLGWAFLDGDCVPLSGCDCAPDCAAFSTDFDSCVAGCVGYCDASAFVGDGIGPDNWGAGTFCDSIFVCIDPNDVPFLQGVITATDCSDTCPNGQTRCTVAFAGEVQPAQMTEFCNATLVASVDEIACLVIGP